MTNNADAQIARQWALRAVESAENTQPVSRGALAAARHILATTTPPTMADVEWDDAVHAGLCAMHANRELVRMIDPDPDNEDAIICHWVHYGSPMTGGMLAEMLTPLPGTRVDLTPRREPEPESTPDHPAVLTTEEDYESAPAGTVVAESEETPWMKRVEGLWEHVRQLERDDCDMNARSRRVLRWGWDA